MLVTTCPECGTTFRVSVGVLEKADGQVRCGRCATIFDANVRLRQLEARRPEPKSAPLARIEPDQSDDPAAITAEEPAPLIETQPQREPTTTAEAEPEAEAESEAEAEPEAEAEAETETEEEAEAEAKAEVDPEAEAETPGTEPVAPATATAPPLPAAVEAATDLPAWRPVEPDRPRRHWGWTAGSILLAVSLLGQLMHQFRAELVSVPLVGTALAGVYDRLGSPPVSTDIDQYDLLDLTAVAEPATDDQGWLLIETRVHNRGPKIQPYPYIFVRLLDRWEDTIAGRYFGPKEYAVNPIDDNSLMSAGRTIDAQFIIMDPGPSATGFELELCIRIDEGYLCESDFTDD